MEIRFKDVTLSNDGKINILENLSFTIPSGNIVFIFGKSGVGKTTIINAITNPKIIRSGNIFIDDMDIKKIRKKALRKLLKQCGFLSQENTLISDESVYENIKLSIKTDSNPFFKFFGYTSILVRDKILKLLDEYSILDKAFIRVADISGGEKQRVELIKVQLNHSKIILADEPTTSLDMMNSKFVIDKLLKTKSTIILNTHKLDIVPTKKSRVIVIKNKQIVFDDIFSKLRNIKEYYEKTK